MNISKNTISSFAMLFLVACGGGGDKDSPVPEVPVIRDVQLNGSATIGTALTGVLAVYPITADGVSKTVNLAGSLATGDDGSFSLSIPDLEADAIYIEVESDDRPLRCGIDVCERDASGNPEKKFGDEYTPKKKITLGGIISVRNSNQTSVNSAFTRAENSSVSIQAHLNVFTELAAKLAQSGTSGKTLVEAANEANVKVNNRFRLADDLFTSLPVSLVQADSVNGAAKPNLKRELKSAGLLGAGLDSSGTGTIADSLAFLASQFTNSGIADTEVSPNSNTITIEKSLAKASAILAKVGEVPSVDTTGTNFTEAKSELVGEEKFAQNGSTEPSQGDVAADQGATGLAAVKAFSSQIRNFANVVVGAAPSQAALDFQAQLDLVSQVTSVDANIIDSALASSLNAIRYAYDAYTADNTLTSFSYNDITVAITKNGDTVNYAVSQVTTIDGSAVTIGISGVDDGSHDNSTPRTDDGSSYGEVADFEHNLRISGEVSNENLKLEILGDGGNATQSTLALKFQGTEGGTYTNSGSSYANTNYDYFTATASADVFVRMTQVDNAVDDPVTFTGSLTFSLNNFKYKHDSSESEGNGSYEESSTTYTDLDAGSFTLSGKILSESGKSLSATASVSISDLHTVCTESYSSGNSGGTFSSMEADDCDFNNESQSNYADISLSILMNLDLPSLADDATLEIRGERTGLVAATVAVKALYDGQMLDISFDYDNKAKGTVRVSNQNQVILTLNESDLGVVSGFMTKAGVRYADVDEDAGLVTITYSDGSFESFM